MEIKSFNLEIPPKSQWKSGVNTPSDLSPSSPDMEEPVDILRDPSCHALGSLLNNLQKTFSYITPVNDSALIFISLATYTSKYLVHITSYSKLIFLGRGEACLCTAIGLVPQLMSDISKEMRTEANS